MTHTITVAQRSDGMIRLSFGWLVMYFETHETDEIAAYVKKYAKPDSHVTVVNPIDEKIVKLVRESLPQPLLSNSNRLKEERDDLLEALVNLENAARGMPNSHDNLCQSTLNLACEEARELMERIDHE